MGTTFGLHQTEADSSVIDGRFVAKRVEQLSLVSATGCSDARGAQQMFDRQPVTVAAAARLLQINKPALAP